MLDKVARWACERSMRRIAAKHSNSAKRMRRWHLWRGFVLAGAWFSTALTPAYTAFGGWLLHYSLPHMGQPEFPGSPQSLLPAACAILLLGPGFALLSVFGFRVRRISGRWPMEGTPAA